MTKSRPRSRRAALAALPVLAIDGEAARRDLGGVRWAAGRFEVLELPDRLAVGQLAALLRSLRSRPVVVWPSQGEAGLERARRRAAMLAEAGVSAVGLVMQRDEAPDDPGTLIDAALREALLRALPEQGCRAARAVVPWTLPIKPEAVLARVQALLAKHIDMPHDLIETMALWCLHAWCVRAPSQPFELSPRLILQGEDARADHARALRVLAWFTPAPLVVSRTIAAHVLPMIAAERPTLLFDDVTGGMLYRRDMRTLIAAGALRDGIFLGASTRAIRAGARHALRRPRSPR